MERSSVLSYYSSLIQSHAVYRTQVVIVDLDVLHRIYSLLPGTQH